VYTELSINRHADGLLLLRIPKIYHWCFNQPFNLSETVCKENPCKTSV